MHVGFVLHEGDFVQHTDPVPHRLMLAAVRATDVPHADRPVEGPEPRPILSLSAPPYRGHSGIAPAVIPPVWDSAEATAPEEQKRSSHRRRVPR